MAGEINTGDMAVGQAPSFVLPALGEEIIHGESIPGIDTAFIADYQKDLAFMEEMVTIRVEPSSEENAPQIIDLYVNGVPVWVRVGVNEHIKRKYVEVLARAKPMKITTEHDTPENAPDGGPQNRVKRTTRAMHVFSVIEDKNPLGAAWLQRIIAER